MTFSSCLNAFDAEIFQQDTAQWVLLTLGLVIVLSALYILIFKDPIIINVVILLLIGGAFVSSPRIGRIPFIAGTFDKPSFESVELTQTLRAACIYRYQAKASDAPANNPEDVIKVEGETVTTALENVASLSNEKSLVWIFYTQSRKSDAEELRDQLLSLEAAVIIEEDDFSQVTNQPPAGTTRIIYNDHQAAALSQAIAELASVQELGKTILLQGPYGSISRGPVQLQLY